jgi:hypothetical protein
MTYYTILLVGGFIVILCCLASLFWFSGCLLPLLYKGAPFVPTSKNTTKQMIDFAKIVSSDRVADLGSGDGRLLFGAIAAGAQSAEGYEIHPGLVWFSRLKAKWKRMSSRITIHQKTFWDADLSQISLVFLYQLPNPMTRLSDKLKRELPPGARVVSNTFTFPNWKPEEVRGKIYLYKI